MASSVGSTSLISLVDIVVFVRKREYMCCSQTPRETLLGTSIARHLGLSKYPVSRDPAGYPPPERRANPRYHKQEIDVS